MNQLYTCTKVIKETYILDYPANLEHLITANFGPSVYFATSPVSNLTAVPSKRAICHNEGMLAGMFDGNASPPTRVDRVRIIALRLTRMRGPDHIKTSASENRVVYSIFWILRVARKALGCPEILVGWLANFGPSVYFPTCPILNLTAVPSKRAICHSMGILAGMFDGNASPPMRINRVRIIAFRLARSHGPDHIKASASENRVVCSIFWILRVARKALGCPEILVGWLANFGPSVYFPTCPILNLTAVPSKRAICHSMGILAGMFDGNASPPMRINRVRIIAFHLARSRGPDHIKTSASKNRVVCSIFWVLRVARKALGCLEILVGWPSVYFPTCPVPNLTAVPSKRAICHSIGVLTGVFDSNASPPTRVNRVRIIALRLTSSRGSDHIKTSASENRVVCSISWIFSVARKALGCTEILVG